MYTLSNAPNIYNSLYSRKHTIIVICFPISVFRANIQNTFFAITVVVASNKSEWFQNEYNKLSSKYF